MTTAEIEKRFAKQTSEINKLKNYNTRLAKELVKNKLEVPVPKWGKENSEDPKD